MAVAEVVTDFFGMERVVVDAHQRFDRLVDLWDIAATAAHVWGVFIDPARVAGGDEFVLVFDALVYRIRLESDEDAANVAAAAEVRGGDAVRLILSPREPERWPSPLGTAEVPAVPRGLKRGARAEEEEADCTQAACTSPSSPLPPLRQRRRLGAVQEDRLFRTPVGESAPRCRSSSEVGLDYEDMDAPLHKRQRLVGGVSVLV